MCIRDSLLTASSDRRCLCSHLYVIYSCIFESYVNIKQFYKAFYVCQLFVLIFVASVYYVIIIINEHSIVEFVLCVANIAGIKIVILCLAVCITNELQRTHNLLKRLYYENRFRHNQTTFRRWIIEYSHRDTAFDRRYFLISFSVLPIVFNFVSLLVFAGF